MPVDPTRAGALLVPYQLKVNSTPSVKTTYPQAREVLVDTHIASLTGATSLASSIAARLGSFGQAFTVETGAYGLKLSDLDGSPPTFTCEFDRFNAKSGTFLPAGIAIDIEGKSSTIEVRG
ncbi:hypothetical protein ACSMXM_05400 [Pacificimonas sp. ICDLI1SI03]